MSESAKEYFETDLHYLTALDSRPISFETDVKPTWSFDAPEKVNENDEFEVKLKERAEQSMNLLVESVFSLAKTQKKASSCTLPDPINVLPRFKPLPERKPETKWEKFAKEKGISKKKRDRMVWNEESHSFKPRFGYVPEDKQKDWLVELKDGDDPTQDKFQANRRDKKLKILKNKSNQLRNKEMNSNNKGNSKKQHFGIGVTEEGSDMNSRGKRALKGKKGTKVAFDRAQVSTASLGKFDERQRGEKESKNSSTKRQKRDDNLDFGGKDIKRRDQRIMESVLGTSK